MRAVSAEVPVQALPDNTPSNFLLLDALDRCDAARAVARRTFAPAPAWQGLEGMAQLAALHARWKAGFALHAFLLTVEQATWPGTDQLHGPARITATLLAESDRAATYDTAITPALAASPVSPVATTAAVSIESAVCAAPPLMRATLTIGRMPYDTRFRQARLAARHQELFAWLTAQSRS